MTHARLSASNLANLLSHEHSSLAEFIEALAEFDRLKLWRELGYEALFTYLHRELGLSKSAAAVRKMAAELAQKYPAVLTALREGKLCLSTVHEVSRVITEANATEVLPMFFGLSRQEAQELAVYLAPARYPPMRDYIRMINSSARMVHGNGVDLGCAVPAAYAAATVAPELEQAQPPAGDAGSFQGPPAYLRFEEIRALTGELWRYGFTASSRLHAKIKAARAWDPLESTCRHASLSIL